uniref:uncharacterized protein LOC105349434 n=1 Tax=Fragaria vesca subsp. vesca TaxID=101020 RepID=UPI0005C8D3BA|nr:PREDICTED: uncharacterized protein LOC105349434 [Fragaria vesca subsp. vesca]
MVPEINYDRAYKNGARAFSHAVEPLDAQNWVETIEKMFIQFTALFRERYISHAHVHRMREEFLNLQKGDDMTVMDLVRPEQEKIYQFTKGLGGIYANRMTAVPYQSFHQAVTFALNIEAQELAAGRLHDSGGYSQGSSKKLASTSGSGSSSGSGHGSSSSPGSGFRGKFKRQGGRSFKNFFRRQFRRFRSGSSSRSGTSSGQSFQSRQNQFQPGGCFQCGQLDHFKRDCPLLTQGAAYAPTQAMGQTSTGGSSSGTRAMAPARGGFQQGRG